MAEYLENAKKAYQITADTGSVEFSQGGRDGEIYFTLKVSQPPSGEAAIIPGLDVYELDCETPVLNAVVATLADISGTETIDGTVFDLRPVDVDVDVTKLAELPATIFNYLGGGSQASLKFCVRADIGSIVVGDTTSTISFVKVKFDILLNMSEDFSDAAYTVTVEESSAVGGTEEQVQVDYGCRSP